MIQNPYDEPISPFPIALQPAPSSTRQTQPLQSHAATLPAATSSSSSRSPRAHAAPRDSLPAAARPSDTKRGSVMRLCCLAAPKQACRLRFQEARWCIPKHVAQHSGMSHFLCSSAPMAHTKRGRCLCVPAGTRKRRSAPQHA